MYQNYFGLKEQAFSIAVNPRYLYMSQQHKEALAHLLYGVKEGGFVMLTGEVGTGKTTIIRCLLEQLPKNTEIAIILNPMANIRELLCTICDELRIPYDGDKVNLKSLTDSIHRRLLLNHKQGKNTVLLIDEAQLLSAEVLEQVRLLTNLETSTKKLLQIVLVGQPELNELLAQPRLRQLSQRITARFHLRPLSVEETERYISHRLQVAGMPESRNPFSPRIIRQIHRFTGGIPRMINVLCERTLIGAYGHNKAQIDSQIFQLAKREVEGHRPSISERNTPPLWLYGVLAASTIVGLGLIIFVTSLIFSSRPAQVPVTAMAPASSPSLPSSGPVAGSIERAPSPQADPVTKFSGELEAQAALFRFLDFDLSDDTRPCWQVEDQNTTCSRATLETWDDLRRLNRPAVLTLIDAAKFRSYAALVGLSNEAALLLDAEGERQRIELGTLGPEWTGDVLYLWRKPEGFDGPLALGESGSTVAAIAEQFALLDGQPKPLTGKRFNRALRERVKIFQREHKLEDDGIIGERTLLKLEEALGTSTTLVTNF